MHKSRLAVFAALAIVAASLAAPEAVGASPGPAVASYTPGSPSCGAPIAKDSGGYWTCTLDDEFDGTSVDASRWAPVTTAASGLNAGGGCFVDSPDNISVSDGTLKLTAQKEPNPVLCTSPTGTFRTPVTSGQISSTTKFSQTYGRFSVRAKFPASTVRGLHSALWMWPQNPYQTGLLGEIDIAEVYSAFNDRAIPYLHYLYYPWTVDLATNSNIVTNNYCTISDVSAFHEYTVEWTTKTIAVLYDGQLCVTDNLNTFGPSPFDQPYFITLTESLGIGANSPTYSTPLPATTQVDWVRVWK